MNIKLRNIEKRPEELKPGYKTTFANEKRERNGITMLSKIYEKTLGIGRYPKKFKQCM